MLVVSTLIFVADAKLIYGCSFVAPLKIYSLHKFKYVSIKPAVPLITGNFCFFVFFYNNIYKWQKITSKKADLRKQNNTISKT